MGQDGTCILCVKLSLALMGQDGACILCVKVPLALIGQDGTCILCFKVLLALMEKMSLARQKSIVVIVDFVE